MWLTAGEAGGGGDVGINDSLLWAAAAAMASARITGTTRLQRLWWQARPLPPLWVCNLASPLSADNLQLTRLPAMQEEGQ